MLSFFRQPDDSWDTGHTVMRGWLWKMKRKARSSLLPRSAWTRRWFTVESGALQWYHNRSSLVPSGSIPLKTLYSCQLFERSADGTNSSFVVRSKQRSLLLRCDDLRALDYWVRGLNLQMDLLKSDNALRRRKTSRHPDGGRAGTPDQYSSMISRLDSALDKITQLERDADGTATGGGGGGGGGVDRAVACVGPVVASRRLGGGGSEASDHDAPRGGGGGGGGGGGTRPQAYHGRRSPSTTAFELEVGDDAGDSDSDDDHDKRWDVGSSGPLSPPEPANSKSYSAPKQQSRLVSGGAGYLPDSARGGSGYSSRGSGGSTGSRGGSGHSWDVGLMSDPRGRSAGSGAGSSPGGGFEDRFGAWSRDRRGDSPGRGHEDGDTEHGEWRGYAPSSGGWAR